MTPTDPTGPGDPLDPVVADYLQRAEDGKSPDRDDVLAMHPDLADPGDLADLLGNLDVGLIVELGQGHRVGGCRQKEDR